METLVGNSLPFWRKNSSRIKGAHGAPKYGAAQNSLRRISFANRWGLFFRGGTVKDIFVLDYYFMLWTVYLYIVQMCYSISLYVYTERYTF